MSARPVVTLADLSNFKGHTFGGKASKGEQGPVCHSSFRFSGCRPVVRQRRSAHILDLPVEVCRQIFKHLDKEARLCELPLVCKQWREMLTGSAGLAFETLHFDLGRICACDLARGVVWLRRKARGVQRLSLDGGGQDLQGLLAVVPDSVHTMHIQGAVTRQELLVLASLTSLTSLWLEDPETEGYKNDPTVLGGCLSALHNLQHVRLAATVMPRLQSLTNLVSLQIHTETAVDGLCTSRLLALRHLDISCTQAISLVLTQMAPGLTQLQVMSDLSLRLYTGGAFERDVHLTALTCVNLNAKMGMGFSLGVACELSGLRTLQIGRGSSGDWPDCSERLVGLENLCVYDGQATLRESPANIVQLTSLTRLELHAVSGMSCLPAHLSQLGRLRVLVVSGSKVPFKLSTRDLGELRAVETVVLADMTHIDFFRTHALCPADYYDTLVARHPVLTKISLHGSGVRSSRSLKSFSEFVMLLAAKGRADLVTFDLLPLPNCSCCKHGATTCSGALRYHTSVSCMRPAR